MIEESARYSGQSQFEQAKLWRSVNLLFGIPTSALAAVAGASALAEIVSLFTAGLLALSAAALGAVMTTMNAPQRVQSAEAAANAYLALEADARVLRTADMPSMAFSEARSALSELTARRNEINQMAPAPSFYAYWRGRRNIEKGRQTYEVERG